MPEWKGHAGAFPISDFPNPAGFQNQTARLAGWYQADSSLGSRHLLTAGGEVEHETGELGNRAGELLRPTRTNFGVYLQDRVLLGSRAYLTLGGRVEQNGSYGTHAVPRAALARAPARRRRTRRRCGRAPGMGVKEPSFLESYGESFFAKGNPDLDPERSTTFDVGVEQRLFGEPAARGGRPTSTTTTTTRSRTRSSDFNTFEGTYVNLARTQSRGRRARARGAAGARRCSSSASTRSRTARSSRARATSTPCTPPGGRCCAGRGTRARSRAAYTFRARQRRARRSSASASAPTATSSASASQGERPFYNPGYTRLDARLRVRVAGPVEAFVVAENLLDAGYQEVLGYPALGRSCAAACGSRSGGRP